MKSLKIALASILLLGAVFAFTNKSHDVRTPVTVDNQLAWDGGNQSGADFVIASGTKAWLNDAVNWGSAFATYSTSGCSGAGKICKVRITYTYDVAQEQSDPNPSIQNVVDAVYAAYNDAGTHSFSTPITFTVGANPIVITVTIIEKS